MIKSVVFDCFGVLTQDGWTQFVEQYATPDILDDLRYINRQADKGLATYDEFLSRICELTQRPIEEAHTMITTTHHPSEPVFDVVRRLKKAGYELGLISNVGSELTNYLPEEYVNLFQHIVLSYQVAAIKPEPRIYEAYLEKTDILAEETVFIDDREYNCDGAKAVGMQAFVYTTPEKLVADLKSIGVKIH